MPDENVVIKFGTQGAEDTSSKVDKVSNAFAKLTGNLNASIAFIQQQQKALEQSTGTLARHGAAAEGAGESHTHMSHKVRGAAHIITGSIGGMAGAIDTEFGRIIGSVGMGAHMLRYFGASVAVGVVALEAISTVIDHYIKKVKEGIEFQVKLNMAMKGQDLGAVQAMLNQQAEAQERLNVTQKTATQALTGVKSSYEVIVAYWAGVFGPKQSEITEKTDKARTAFQQLFDLLERPKLNLEAQNEVTKMYKERGQLEIEEAQNIGQIVAGMNKQTGATEDLMRAQLALARVEEEQKAKKLEAAGAAPEQIEAQRFASAMKIAAMEASADTARMSAKAALEKKIISFEKERLTESLAAYKTYADAKLAMIDTSEQEQLAAIQIYETDAEDKVRATERVKENAAKAGATARIDTINQEIGVWKKLSAEYPNNIEVQRAAQGKLNELALSRLNIEKDTNGKIIAERQSMIEKLKAQEAEKAAVGGSIESKAFADLKKAGYTQITSDMIKQQAENRQKQGEFYSLQYDVLGGSLTPEQFEYMQDTADLERKRKKAGVSTFGGVSMAGQSRRAAYGYGVAPEDMVSGYTGGNEFGDQMADTFKGVQQQVKTSLEDIKKMLTGEELGGHNLANTISDMFVRKLEFEAARAA